MSRYKNIIKLYGLGSVGIIVTHMVDEINYLEHQYKYKNNKNIKLIEYSSAACAGLVIGLPQAIFYPITCIALCTVKISNVINSIKYK